jgi:hypothetical protein
VLTDQREGRRARGGDRSPRRVRLRRNTPAPFAEDPRWLVDTHDPFDRLLVAHARYRGWRLATADSELLEALADREVFDL